MAELGGISFPIRTEYDGSGVQNFIADLSFARSAFRQFKDDLQSGGGAATAFAASQRATADSARAAQAALTKEIAALKALAAAQNAAATAKATSQSGIQSAVAPAAAVANSTKQTAQNLREGAVQASLLNSTIIRMLVFRQIVQFIREGVGLFKEFVKSGVEYDATIEKTRLSIAGLLDSIAIIKDAQGNTLEGAEKFQAAQAQSVILTQKLNEEALRTGISVAELGKTFSVALGPGLQAGLSLDNITKLTGEIAIAASTLNVSENRIAHELRDLTTGHIRSATDRIATSLGISNADIKNAEHAGRLFEFLQTKLQGFNAVAAEAPKTFDGIVDRLKVTSQIVSGLAASSLFEELKSAGADLFKLLSTSGSESSGIVSTLRIVDDALAELVRKGHAFAASLSLQDVQSGVRVFVQILVSATEVITGVLKGFGAVTKVVAAFFSTLASNFGLADASLVNVAALITEIVLGMKLWSLSVGTVQIALTKILPLLTVSAETTATAAKSAGQWAAAIALIPIAVKELAELITGTEVTFKELEVNALANLKRIAAGFTGLGVVFKEVFLGIKNLDLTQIKNAADTARQTVDLAFKQIDEEQAKKLNAGDDFGIVHARAPVFKASGAELAANLTEGFRTKLTADEQKIFDTFDHDVQQRIALAATLNDPTHAREAKPVDHSTVSEALVGLNAQQQELVEKQRAEADLLNQQAAAIARATDAKRTGVSVSEQEILATQAQLDQQVTQIALLEKQQAIERKKLEDSFAANLDPVERARALSALDDQHIAALGKENEQLNAIKEKLRENLALEGKGPEGIAGAFEQTFKNISEKLPSAIKVGLDAATNAINSFSDLVGSAIVDAFDPTKKQGLRERFAAFLQGIAKEILSTLTKIALVKAALGLTSLLGGGGGAVGNDLGSNISFGAADGGYVQHFAEGGPAFARPASVPAVDTIPAWLSPGEFVLPPHAVRAYGLSVLEGMRRGEVSPDSVRALTTRNYAPKAVSKYGFADGGPVADVSAAAAHTSAPTPAFLVANDQVMETLLAGGRSAMLRFLRQHAAQTESFQRRNRQQR